MAETSKLELLLVARDRLSPALQRLLSLLKKTKTDGKGSTDAVDKLTKKLERAPKIDGLKKANAEIKKTGVVAGEAAKAEEKLNNVRKRGQRGGSSGIKQEAADTKKLGEAANTAAKAEEKLAAARKRGSDGRLRDGRGRFLSEGGSGGSGGNRRNSGSWLGDAALTGAGTTGLMISKKSASAAMSQQEAFTDLRNTFYRSSVSAAELNKQMRLAEELAIKLGNDLPGTTSDYVAMLTQLKQGGLNSDTVLAAGKSTAYLAVTNREDPSETAKRQAQFGQIFGLKSEKEFNGAADLMSRFKTSKGVDSTELVEMSKYFGGRTGTSLGMTGSKGAEESLRLLAFLRERTGMEGTMVGEGTSSFFREYLKAKQGRKRTDPLGEIQKLTGVKLNLFDDKGKFLGAENAVQQISQLKGKLSDEELTGIGSKISGDAGGAMFAAMVQYGDQWKSWNKDANETVSLLDKQTQNAGNLSMKIEALSGSLENLGAEGFKPLLNSAGKLTDGANDYVGKLTEMAKSQPVFAATTASVLTLGSSLLTLKGGSGILSSILGRAADVGETAASSTSKIGRLGKSLTSLPTALKIGVTLLIAAEAWEKFQQLREAVSQWQKMNAGLDDTGKMSYTAQKQEDELIKAKNKGAEGKTWEKSGMLSYQEAPDYKGRAKAALDLLQAGSKSFEKSLDPSRMSWMDSFSKTIGSTVSGELTDSLYSPGGGGERWKKKTPEEQQSAKNELSALSAKYAKQPVPSIFNGALDRATKELLGAETIKRRVPMLDNPNTMTAFRQEALPSLNLSSELNQHVQKMLERAFPESFAQSSQQMALGQSRLAEQSGQLGQSFLNLQAPMPSLIEQFGGLNTKSADTVTSLGTLASVFSSKASEISNLQIKAPNFGTVNIPTANDSSAAKPFSIFSLPGRAKGGSVRRGNPYMVGESGKEMFLPETSGSIVSNEMLRSGGRRRGGSGSVAVNFNPTINIHSDRPEDAMKAVEILKREMAILKDDLKTHFSPDRMAQRVEMAAQRDSERT